MADPLPPESLSHRLKLAGVPRPATDHAPPLPGQKRGLEAVAFGLSIKRPYFNITVSGVSRSGKTTMVEQLAHQRAAAESPGHDVCAVPNFDRPDQPGIVYLAPGAGTHVNRLIDELLRTLDEQIPQVTEQPAMKAHLEEMSASFNRRVQELTREVEHLAAEKGLFVRSTPQGISLIPLNEDGRPMSDEDFIALEPERREQIDAARQEVLAHMAQVNPQALELEKERRDTVESYLADAVQTLVRHAMVRLRQRVEEQPELHRFLDALEAEIVEKRYLFLSEMVQQPFGAQALQAMRQQFARSCKLNVLVNRANATGAPVIVEVNPNYDNLLGGVDFRQENGVLKADYNNLRAGSLVQARDGYLVLQAQDLLLYPLAYTALKRALRTGTLVLRDQYAEVGLRTVAHLEPEPIQLDTKVIVIGDEYLIQALYTYDDEFAGLFKIHADFSGTLERTPEVTAQMVAYLAYHARRCRLLPVEDSALVRVVEEAGRRVSHQHRLSAQVNELVDVLIEADQVARQQGLQRIEGESVESALAFKHRRHGKIEELVKREINDGTILLDFDGSKVGQLNGLAVYQVGRVAFGIPTRITAQAFAGRHGVINIDREADLSGSLHTKGVLILNGYLGHLFARQHPLALSVSITFEQTYGGIDGDSATSAEFLAVLSAIAQVPLRQGLAITGSMNQHGQVQAIGGVNEKITGFFEFAKQHGFPEGCGVVIPAANRVHLLLGQEIVHAVSEGRFAIYPVARIEEAVELFTGLPAGEMDATGTYPDGSLYARVMNQLERFMPQRRNERTREMD